MHRWLLLITLFVTANSWADEINYNQIALTVDATKQVENDLLVALLYVQHEGSDPTSLAAKTNTDMQWALDIAKKNTDITSQTMAYNSSPIYKSSQLTGWRVRQELKLESKNIAGLSKLIGQLQSKLAVQSINYRVSDEVRRSVENSLIAEALKNFESRAKLITQQLQRASYKLVNVNIGQNNSQPPRRYMRSMAMSVAESSSPAIEAGSQQMRVSINGTIELSID